MKSDLEVNKIPTSFRSSLKDYLRGNIVSEMNRALWMNVLRTLTTMPDTLNDDEADPTPHDVEPLPTDAFPILNPNIII